MDVKLQMEKVKWKMFHSSKGRRLLKKRIAKESKSVKSDSMKILAEFERFVN